MTPAEITTAARNAYYLGWDHLTDAQKATKYAAAAQQAAARGAFTDAAALVLAATVSGR